MIDKDLFEIEITCLDCHSTDVTADIKYDKTALILVCQNCGKREETSF